MVLPFHHFDTAMNYLEPGIRQLNQIYLITPLLAEILYDHPAAAPARLLPLNGFSLPLSRSTNTLYV